MYRFRSLENLLGSRQELEKQEIYFAPYNKQNDPLEGKRHYFWDGDKIVWENFLKHYILCLERCIFLCMLRNEDETIIKEDIPINQCFDDLPSKKYQNRIIDIYENFFNKEFVKEYINIIVKRGRVDYEELFYYMKLLSIDALESVVKINIDAGLMKKGNDLELTIGNKDNNIKLLETFKLIGDKEYKAIMNAIYEVLKQQDSILLYKYKNSPKYKSICLDFVKMYLERITEISYPEAFIACFMDNCDNSSIWGTYGENHTGVCLKFKTDINKPILRMNIVMGFSTNTGLRYDYANLSLKKVKYTTEFKDVDFFKNIGCLPYPQVEKYWYTNDEGEVSKCAVELFNNIDKWRNDYWENYNDFFLKKIADWKHEREYRIILSNSFGMLNETKNRLAKYDFKDLEAIIFGMKTPQDSRDEIIAIVEKKVEKYKIEKFDFYEMDYSNTKNQLIKRKILTLGCYINK